ncbi:MAG: RNA polymerase subunit sigma-24, partial [Actinomycetota bacterium]
LRRRQPGPYQLQAAIAAVHAHAEAAVDTDWMQIAALYGELGHHQPSPVIALNQAVAVAMWRRPQAGLALIGPLADRLDQYRPFHVARADLLARMGRKDAAAANYRQALALPGNNVEDRYLRRRLDELGGAPD